MIGVVVHEGVMLIIFVTPLRFATPTLFLLLLLILFRADAHVVTIFWDALRLLGWRGELLPIRPFSKTSRSSEKK